MGLDRFIYYKIYYKQAMTIIQFMMFFFAN